MTFSINGAIEAAGEFLDKIEGLLGESERFFGSLNYSEIEPLAELADALGRPKLGSQIMQEWATHDQEVAQERADDLLDWREGVDPRPWLDQRSNARYETLTDELIDKAGDSIVFSARWHAEEWEKDAL